MVTGQFFWITTVRASGVADVLEKLGKGLVVLVFIAYPILLHTYILKENVEVSRLLWVFAPLLLAVTWMIFSALEKIWWPVVALVLAALSYVVVSGDHGRVGLLAVNGLSHATLNLSLLWLFGRTLLRDREPLISQIARHITGPLQPEIVVYTRQVTIAWCVFFLLQVLTSLSLYLFAPVAIWSLFINVLDVPLLAIMFVGEHSYRTARFPDHSRTSILKAIEVYSRDFALPGKTDKNR
jgi:uncharacterized membrane protein